MLPYILPVACRDDLDYRRGIDLFRECKLLLDFGYDIGFCFASFAFRRAASRSRKLTAASLEFGVVEWRSLDLDEHVFLLRRRSMKSSMSACVNIMRRFFLPRPTFTKLSSPSRTKPSIWSTETQSLRAASLGGKSSMTTLSCGYKLNR